MDDLKPCPFCGSTELVEGQDAAQVLCYHCVCQGWRKDWNKRPIEDALRAEIAALKAELAKYTTPLTDEQCVTLADRLKESVCVIGYFDAAIRAAREGAR